MLIIPLDRKSKQHLSKDYLLSLAEENKCNVIKTEWRSSYNSYVVYDYEPFCSDGFNITVHIDGSTENLQYVEYLFNKRLKEVELLKSIHANS